MLLEVLGGAAESPDDRPGRRRAILERLVELYEARGQDRQADRYRVILAGAPNGG